MSLRTAQKMYLVSPHQFKRLTPSETSIRQTVEEDLDSKMREILNEPGLSSYEKIKKYDALLQRYLALMKQGQQEEPRVTLTLQHKPMPENNVGEANSGSTPSTAGLDETASEVLKALPNRDSKNAKYILKKLSESGESWTPKGEFVYRDRVMGGSHILDLLKNLLLPFKRKTQTPDPVGWTPFLTALKELNIPVSSVSNPHARQQYRRLTETAVLEEEEKNGDKPLARRKKKKILSPKFLGLEYEDEVNGKDSNSDKQRSGRVKNPEWLKYSP